MACHISRARAEIAGTSGGVTGRISTFGLIVGVSGCYQGMQVKGNSEEVGTRTTIAVVQAIFVVIVLDAFFAVFFSEIGWG